MKLRCLALLFLFFVGFTICYAEDNQPVDKNTLAKFLPAPLEGWETFSQIEIDTAVNVQRVYAIRQKNQGGLLELVSISIANIDPYALEELNSPKLDSVKTSIQGFPAVEASKLFSMKGARGRSLFIIIKNKIGVQITAEDYTDPKDIDRAKGYLYSWAGKIDYQGLADLVK